MNIESLRFVNKKEDRKILKRPMNSEEITVPQESMANEAEVLYSSSDDVKSEVKTESDNRAPS